MAFVVERRTRIVEPPVATPTPSYPWWVLVASLAYGAVCGWVLVPLFMAAGLEVLALTMLLATALVVGFLLAGSLQRSEYLVVGWQRTEG